MRSAYLRAQSTDDIFHFNALQIQCQIKLPEPNFVLNKSDDPNLLKNVVPVM